MHGDLKAEKKFMKPDIHTMKQALIQFNLHSTKTTVNGLIAATLIISEETEQATPYASRCRNRAFYTRFYPLAAT